MRTVVRVGWWLSPDRFPKGEEVAYVLCWAAAPSVNAFARLFVLLYERKKPDVVVVTCRVTCSATVWDVTCWSHDRDCSVIGRCLSSAAFIFSVS